KLGITISDVSGSSDRCSDERSEIAHQVQDKSAAAVRQAGHGLPDSLITRIEAHFTAKRVNLAQKKRRQVCSHRGMVTRITVEHKGLKGHEEHLRTDGRKLRESGCQEGDDSRNHIA